MELNFYKINDNVNGPLYGSTQAACFDLCGYIEYQIIVKAYTKNNSLVELISAQDAENRNFIDIPSEWRVLIPTGIIFDIPIGSSVRIYPRSGLSSKKGLNLINCVGVIDSDYVEEVYIPVYNNSQEKLRIYNGDRIAQAELVYNQRTSLNVINQKPERKTERSGGFGSTGIL
jgi:deoxyuridine 5'-triphosphate nucleotidohydrolase